MKLDYRRIKVTSLFSAALSLPTHPPDVLITGFKLEQSKGNQRFFQMAAPEAEIYKNEQVAKAAHPQTKIFQASSPNPIELSAIEAIAHLGSYDVLFQGATKVKSPEGFLVQGNNVSYNHAEEKITTDEAVQFESTPEFTTSFIQGWGKSFEADLKAKSFTFKDKIQLSILPREAGASVSKIKGNIARIFTERGWAQIEGDVAFQKDTLSLRSEFLTLDFDIEGKHSGEEAIFQSSGKSYVIALFDQYKLSSKEVVLFLKNRKEINRILAQGDVTLTDNKGLEMSTDKLEIVQPQSPKRKMKLIGDVNIKRGQDEATCNEASFDPEADYLVLKGNAAFKRGLDAMGGEEIRYSKKSGLLQVLKASGQFQKNKILQNK
ncbi:MAG: LPS export ABC transporter periplasmic protein LptC [Bdellovibrionota bacterium]